MAAPMLEVQITLTLLHCLMWCIILHYMVVPTAYRIIHNMKSKKQFLHQTRQSSITTFRYDPGDDEDAQIDLATNVQGIVVSHGTGALLCLPSLLGLSAVFPVGVPAAMARQAGLCELGFEIEDTLVRLAQILFGGENGQKKKHFGSFMSGLMHAHFAFEFESSCPM